MFYHSRYLKSNRSLVDSGIELDDIYSNRQSEDSAPIRLSSVQLSGLFVLLAIINFGLLTWLLIYVPRITRPYDYPEWAFGDIRTPHSIALFVLLFILSLINGLLTLTFFKEVVRRKSDSHADSAAGLFFLIGGLCTIFALIWPICCFTSIPNNIWKNMMKDTCIGFDTRVRTLDKTMGSGKYTWTARDHKLVLYYPEDVHPELHIGSHTTQNPQDPLQHYKNFFRITGSTLHTEHISVDFDFDHRIWRMFQMEEADYRDAWYADDYEKKKPKPLVHKQSSMLPTDKLIKNGSWSKSTNRSNHSLIIPELEIQIPHWYGFTQTWAFEPFLKMHRTSNMTVEEIQAQADAKWTKFNDETVVMRTASFGAGQGDTAVCIRGEDWEENGVVYKGLGDDALVPLGLLALYRIRFQDENLRGSSHKFSGNGAHQDVLT